MRFLPHFRTFALAALAGGLLCTTSCKKDSATATDDVVSAQDAGQGSEENAATADFVEAAAPQDASVQNSAPVAGTTELRRLLPECATRTYDAATRTLTLDFGSTNCLCPDGRYRRGKLLAVFSGTFHENGSKVTVTRENYFVNDNQHLGTRVFTYTGNGSFTLNVQNASIIFANGSGTTTWNSLRQYSRTAGFGTPTVFDDAYSITGTLDGTNRRGVSYTAVIVQPLIKKLTAGCARHFVAGTVQVDNSKERTMLINYDPTGTEACDNIASVTVNGHTYTIYLK